MPNLSGDFEAKVSQALELADKVEAARLLLVGRTQRALLHPERVEMIYEMAFFRCYLAWEEFLEQSFVRYLAGYVSALYTPLRTGVAVGTIAAANSVYLGGRPYKLWHDPGVVIARAAGFLVGSPHETVIRSAMADLTQYAAIRHRIAHAQSNAKNQFDSACVALIGHHVRGSKPGKLLRMAHPGPPGGALNPSFRWLHQAANEYVSLAKQIV
jgi:hypothetical protein